MSGERVRYVAWGSAVAGGLIGFALIVAFVYFVDPPVEAVLAPAGKIVTFGIVLMLVTLLRVIAGMWTAQLTRRRHEARERTDFLPTAAV
ncbi:MAG: hypothetical protein LBR32_07100, partial [Propionibacteriaceae bacterium]|nr:hypothetical protein [Propionibacteriaceae bacterium]